MSVLEQCLNKKDFVKCTTGLMTLYLRLVEEFAGKVKPYSDGLNASATVVVCCSNARAAERELAIRIIRELIERKVLADDQYPVLLAKLLGVMATKLTDRFAQKLYQTIGLILKDHPQHVALGQALDFRRFILSVLEKFVCAGNTISFLVASGAFFILFL